MKENSKNTNEQILLRDVRHKLREARTLAMNVPCELHNLADYMASVANSDEIVPIGMIYLLSDALYNIKYERYGFANKVAFPEELKNERFQITLYLGYFPLIIDKIASKAFADEFRVLFVKIFGAAQPPVDDTKEDFGVTILEIGMVDISNKDKAEVLAALYNNSHPHGMGFIQYNPETMTTEQAREILKDTCHFNYLFGRIMKINLEKDIVYTYGYNRYNGNGAAERIISQCRNIR